MKDLIQRMRAQGPEASYNRRPTALSRRRIPSPSEEVIMNTWKALVNCEKYKRTLVLYSRWREYENFKDWWLENRVVGLTFTHRFSLELPRKVGPETCAWVHEEVDSFLQWLHIHATRPVGSLTNAPGVRYVKNRSKYESHWVYRGEVFANYTKFTEMAECQRFFKSWLMEKIDQILALVNDDVLCRDILALRGRVLDSLEKNSIFVLEV